MKRLLTFLLLFGGFVLLLLGAFFALTGLFPYPKTPSGACWSMMAIGLCMAFGGWLMRRAALSRWRAEAPAKEEKPDQ